MTEILLGIPSLDEQHDVLLGLLGAFQLAVAAQQPPEEIRIIIDTARAALRAHFQHEEALMAKSGFTGAAAHRDSHRVTMQMVDSLAAEALDIRIRSDEIGEKMELLRSLALRHIGREDRALSHYLIAMGC